MVQAYLVYYNPTVSEIVGWEGWTGLSGTAQLYDTVIYYGGVNNRTPPEFAISYPEPIACSGGLMLMALWYFIWDMEPNCLFLSGVSNPSVEGTLPVLYLQGGEYLQATTYPFYEGSNVVARINGTWGSCDGATTLLPS